MRRFSKAEAGNVAMILALALPVLVLLVGGGIDVRQFINSRAYVQAAEDAAVLAAAKAYFADPSLTVTQRKAAAQAAADHSFNAQLSIGPGSIKINSWALNIDDTTGEIAMTVDGGSMNNFAGVLGYPVMGFDVKS